MSGTFFIPWPHLDPYERSAVHTQLEVVAWNGLCGGSCRSSRQQLYDSATAPPNDRLSISTYLNLLLRASFSMQLLIATTDPVEASAYSLHACRIQSYLLSLALLLTLCSCVRPIPKGHSPAGKTFQSSD